MSLGWCWWQQGKRFLCERFLNGSKYQLPWATLDFGGLAARCVHNEGGTQWSSPPSGGLFFMARAVHSRSQSPVNARRLLTVVVPGTFWGVRMCRFLACQNWSHCSEMKLIPQAFHTVETNPPPGIIKPRPAKSSLPVHYQVPAWISHCSLCSISIYFFSHWDVVFSDEIQRL